jgi:hypothetical protein
MAFATVRFAQAVWIRIGLEDLRPSASHVATVENDVGVRPIDPTSVRFRMMSAPDLKLSALAGTHAING